QELKIEGELAAIRKDYLKKKRTNPEVTPFVDQKDVANPFEIYKKIGELAKIDLLKDLENRTLAYLNFSVKIQTEKIADMLNDLLNRIQNQQVIVSELYQYLLPYKGKDDLFDALIFSLKRELKKLSHNFSPKTQLSSISKINLVLAPSLKLDHLPRYNPEIVNICEKLENYVFRGSKKKSSFFSAKNHCGYTKEVNEIVQRILRGDLLTAEAIFHELAKINIESRKDELILLRNDLQSEKVCVRKL
ncbi:TPA: Dot/Icm T4SS effector Lem11, partial [Legionella pneumophila]